MLVAGSYSAFRNRRLGKQVMTDKPTHHMQDWLDLHGLTMASCTSLLETVEECAKESQRTTSATDPETWPSGLSLWSVVVSALTVQLPDLGTDIARASTDAIVNFSPELNRHPRAFTLYIPEKNRIYTSCPLSNSAQDVVVVAHEFGHVLQLHFVADPPLVPVLRETCAFLAEELVLKALPELRSDLMPPVSCAIAASRAQALGRMRNDLLRAVKDATAPYDYNWNYPPARIMASHLAQPGNNQLRNRLFRGEISLLGLRKYLHL